MNWFYTSGGAQQGPVSWEALLSLAQSGRLHPNEMVWAEGMPNWQPAASIPGLFPPGVASVGGPPPPVYPAYTPPPASTQTDEALKWVVPIGRSGWAIAAGYLGLLSLAVVFAPFAIIAGLLALNDIKRHPEKTGKGRAIFGLVMGVICTLFFGFLIITAMLSKP